MAAQSGLNVLLVANRNSPVSKQIAEYYRNRRAVPPSHVCLVATTTAEEIDWATYVRDIEQPVAACLKRLGIEEQTLYIVTTLGVPLKIDGTGGREGEHASVDSELTLLYAKRQGKTFERAGRVPNPFFMARDEPFAHPRFPIYLVTRLAAWDFADVKAMIDRSLAAKNRGQFVVDLSPGSDPGNGWLRTAAMLLPPERVFMDDSPKAVFYRKDVIGYVSWGSNDQGRDNRWLGFEWLPGAIASEFVSTNARTMKKPPDNWTFRGWDDAAHNFGGSSQSLSADYIHEGATGVSGNVYEPYLDACPRPDYLLPAYYQGRNLAESFYLSLEFLSWQSVILGDPLCSLGPPGPAPASRPVPEKAGAKKTAAPARGRQE